MNQKKLLKIILIIIQIGFLYSLSVIGNLIVTLLNLPIPGSIIGLLILFLGLYFKIIPVTFIKEGAGFILVILPMFLIPSTVGVVQYPELLSVWGMMLIFMIMISTFLTMIVVGRVSGRFEEKGKEEGRNA